MRHYINIPLNGFFIVSSHKILFCMFLQSFEFRQPSLSAKTQMTKFPSAKFQKNNYPSYILRNFTSANIIKCSIKAILYREFKDYRANSIAQDETAHQHLCCFQIQLYSSLARKVLK